MKIAKQNEGKRLSDICRDSLAEILSYFDSPRDWRSFFGVCKQLYIDLTESYETIWGMINICFKIGPSDLLSKSWDSKIVPRLKYIECYHGKVTSLQISNAILCMTEGTVEKIRATDEHRKNTDTDKFWGFTRFNSTKQLLLGDTFSDPAELDELAECLHKQKSLQYLVVKDHECCNGARLSRQMLTFVSTSGSLMSYSAAMRRFGTDMTDSVVRLIRVATPALKQITILPTINPEESDVDAITIEKILRKIVDAGGRVRVWIRVNREFRRWYMQHMPDDLLRKIVVNVGSITNLYDLREKERKENANQNSIV